MKKFLIFIIITGCVIYFKTDIKYYISNLFKKSDLDISITLGTEENPFDWSTAEKQIASVPDLPDEGTEIYILSVSGNVRLVKAGEIAWAKNEYLKQSTNYSLKPVTVKPQIPTHTSNQSRESSQDPYIPDPPLIIYYGADIGQFPPHVRNWIINEGFTKSKMEGNGKINPRLNAWWSDDGNSVRFEASYTVAYGYSGAGRRETWGSGAYYSGGDLQVYGQYAKYKTLKFEYGLKREVEYLLEHDSAYAEVINFAKQLCSEIEYDWSSFDSYKGARPVKSAGMRYAVCSGYSNEVMNKALLLTCIKSVEEWTGPNHAWNVINLFDDRRLFFDLTWFDNEHINEETGEIYQTDDYDWENITFDEDLFRHSNIGYSTTIFIHDQGKFNRIVRK